MNGAVTFLIFVTFQRFIEFIWDWQNTQRLRAAAAIEFGGLHYPAMILVHAGWLAGLWALGYDRDVVPAYLTAFLVLQIARYWVLATLGRRWTTRVIVLPGAPLIESGPYRLMRHPNYVVVAGELVLAPLSLRLPIFALVFLTRLCRRRLSAHPGSRARRSPGRPVSVRARRGGPRFAGGFKILQPAKRKRPHEAGAYVRLCANQRWTLALSHAIRGMSERVMPISASSRSPS